MRTIKLKDGTIMTVYDIRYSLGELIYEHLGADAGNMFDDYMDMHNAIMEDYREEIKELREKLNET